MGNGRREFIKSASIAGTGLLLSACAGATALEKLTPSPEPDPTASRTPLPTFTPTATPTRIPTSTPTMVPAGITITKRMENPAGCESAHVFQRTRIDNNTRNIVLAACDPSTDRCNILHLSPNLQIEPDLPEEQRNYVVGGTLSTSEPGRYLIQGFKIDKYDQIYELQEKPVELNCYI